MGETHTDKETWKATVKEAVESKYKNSLETEATLKSTLLHLSPCRNMGTPPTSLAFTSKDPNDVRKLAMKLKMLTGTYITQAIHKAFNQNQASVSLICNDGDEDLAHLLLKCSILEETRQLLLKMLFKQFAYVTLDHPSTLPDNHLLQLILDQTN